MQNSEWINGAEFRAKHGLFQSDLLNAMMQGVHVLDERGYPIKFINDVFEFHFGSSQENPGKIIEGVDVFFFNPDQLEKFFNISLNESETLSSNVVISTPDNTTWDQIKIRVVNQNRIEITVHNEMEPYTSRDIGFASKRTLWPLFEQFAEYKGKLLLARPMKANVSNLRNHLKTIFPGIDGNPIEKYTPSIGYVCNFRIMDSSSR